MKVLKTFFYFFSILLLQTIILPSFKYFGIVADLVLVSVIIFAVLEEDLKVLLIVAAVAGFMQDLCSFGIYFNLLSKVIVALFVYEIRERYFGDEYSLVALLVFLVTPFLILIQGLLFLATLEWFKVVVATVYNLLMVPILWPVLRRICHES